MLSPLDEERGRRIYGIHRKAEEYFREMMAFVGEFDEVVVVPADEKVDTFEEVATDYILKEYPHWPDDDQVTFIYHVQRLAIRRFFC